MIVLSVLGTGNYNSTRYCWGERCHETRLFPAALAAWFPDATIKVLATNAAWDKWGETLRAHVPRAQCIIVPDGASEDELWAIFNTLAEVVPEGEEVVFDITHGFRSLPVLALLATAFLRVAKKVRVRHLLYGAYEQRNKEANESPVFDLTPFVDLLDWTAATERFLETGDARKFGPLLTERRPNPLNAVAAKLNELSEALALTRPALIARRAEELSSKIEAAKIKAAKTEPWELRHAPLRLLLNRIESGFAPLADADPLRAQWEQIGWLTRHGHYPAAVALAREWMVSVCVWTQGGSVLPARNAEREEAERWMNAAGREGNPVPEAWRAALALWKDDPNLSDLRNDLMHCGMRESAKPPKTIVKQVKALPKQLAEAVRPLGLELGQEVKQP